jgi:carbamoyl-phosphate synthase small subunit
VLGQTRTPAVLVLQDGTRFRGWQYGQSGITVGEIVFNTSMTGYQEILTDPSYHRQMITMTTPHIGNYGVNRADMESDEVYASGFVLKAPSTVASNWRADAGLEEWLREMGVVGICGVDTRALVRKIRSEGVMLGVIAPGDSSDDTIAQTFDAEPSMAGRDLASEVTCSAPYHWTEGLVEYESDVAKTHTGARFKVVAVDFGIKRNILRLLVDAGCDVTVVPSDTRASEILALRPEGVFLSNGPGDPAAVSYALESIKHLMGKLPMFGICLGHQLACLAMGASTYKMAFGHRGGNQPVLDQDKSRVEITSQNHGFAVDPTGLPSNARVSHVHLNDQTCAGVRCPDLQFMSIQFHPESSPGPHDSRPLFDEFVGMMKANR